MPITRRDFLSGIAAAATWPAIKSAIADDGAPTKSTSGRLGIAQTAYAIRFRSTEGQKLRDPLEFLTFCRERGAGGAQLVIPVADAAHLAKIRDFVESSGMILEGSSHLPREASDVDRFEAEMKAAKAAGASAVRTVLLGTRRYETLNSADEFRQFADRAWKSLTLAEPVMARQNLPLAIENHKDFRDSELADILKRLASEHIGACVDVGNDLALLEEPTQTVEILGPYAICVHLKDMAVKEYSDGFMLSEVNLGQGILDLKQLVEALRKARPQVHFFLEMITRDPLKVPCLTPQYWSTLDEISAHRLAAMLALVRAKQSTELPKVTGLSEQEQLKLEDENVRKCLAYAKDNLSL